MGFAAFWRGCLSADQRGDEGFQFFGGAGFLLSDPVVEIGRPQAFCPGGVFQKTDADFALLQAQLAQGIQAGAYVGTGGAWAVGLAGQDKKRRL